MPLELAAERERGEDRDESSGKWRVAASEGEVSDAFGRYGEGEGDRG